MKKVGVLTFLRTLNYGAMFQAYALCEFLCSEGFECEQIDYRNATVEAFEYKKGATLKSKVANIWRGRHVARKSAGFDSFVERYIPVSEPVNKTTIPSVCERYDFVVVGSDQVWNGNCTGFDATFFLDFLQFNEKKRTYAVSIGQDQLPETSLIDYKKLISDFEHGILVREKTAIPSIRQECQGDVSIQAVVDPTILINSSKWRKISSTSSVTRPEKYVFAYLVAEKENAVKAARQIANQTNAQLVVVQQTGGFPVRGAINLYDLSPVDFLAYMEHADFIVTSSFHGLCLSLQFEKPFVVSLGTDGIKRNSRMLDLLDLVGLSGRVLSDEIGLEEDIDWCSVKAVLDRERDVSGQLLLRSLL